MQPGHLAFVLPLSITVASVMALYGSWRHAHGWKPLTTSGGWLLLCVSALTWTRFGGVEFGVAYACIAVAFTAWAIIAGSGREPRRAMGRGRQPRSSAHGPSRRAIASTLGRAFVAVPLAGAASLLLAVLVAAGLPWTATNRYVFAIGVAPAIWGVLAMWAATTATVARVALALAALCTASATLLFVR
jgi:hypothetical protein